MQNNILKKLFCALAASFILSGCSEDTPSGPQNPPAPAEEVRLIQDSHIDWVLKFVFARFKTIEPRQVPENLMMSLAGAFTSEALNRMDFTEMDMVHPVNQFQMQRIFNKIQERYL